MDTNEASPHTMARMTLGPLDQIMVRGIIRFILCFENKSTGDAEESDHGPLLHILREGLSSLLEQIPFLGGHLHYLDNTRNEVEIRYDTKQNNVELKVKDLSSRLPSYASLVAAKMPLSQFDSDLVSPLPNVLAPLSVQPVFALQANLVKGGIILCLCANHNMVDGVGFSILLKAFAAHCKMISSGAGDDHLVKEFGSLHDEMTTRGSMFDGLRLARADAGSQHKYDEYLVETSCKHAPVYRTTTQLSTSRLFRISSDFLQKLKALAGTGIPNGRYISTVDAFGALAWSRITKARYQSGKLDYDQITKLGVPVDTRKHGHPYLPLLYLGNTAITSMAASSVRSIVEDSLQDPTKPSNLTKIALTIREAHQKIDKAYTQGLISHVQNFEGNLNNIKPQLTALEGPDINYTSWYGFPVYELDFGRELGMVDWFRCPWRATDGVVKVLPKRLDGGMEAIIELERETMQYLLADDEWMCWIGQVVD